MASGPFNLFGNRLCRLGPAVLPVEERRRSLVWAAWLHGIWASGRVEPSNMVLKDLRSRFFGGNFLLREVTSRSEGPPSENPRNCDLSEKTCSPHHHGQVTKLWLRSVC